MSVAFLFPGQGSEAPGMGGALVERPGLTRALLERASGLLEIDVVRSVLRGDASLRRTEVAQAALLAVGVGVARELEASGVRPAALAGHSVGELAAFCAAGCLTPEEALEAAVARGRLMREAARRAPGGMFAVRASAPEEVERAIAAGNGAGRVELAAHNAPGEWVLSGDQAGLAAVAARFAGVPVPVAGPWHSQAMAEAEAGWREALRAVRWRAPAIPLVVNRTGDFLGAGEDPAELLAGQLTRPIRWVRTLRTLAAAGVRDWRVLGPGKVLRGLCRANLGDRIQVSVLDGPPAPRHEVAR